MLPRDPFSLACFQVRFAKKTRGLLCEKERKHIPHRERKTSRGIKRCLACLGNAEKLKELGVQVTPCMKQVEGSGNGQRDTKLKTETSDRLQIILKPGLSGILSHRQVTG